MTKSVLSVGQCGPDHGSLTRFLNQHFDVRIDTADVAADAMQRLEQQSYDLVLVNRKLDQDYSDGMEIIRAIRQDERFADQAVMLVTNFPEHQEAAVKEGAAYGFGKNEYSDSSVVDRLKPFLD